MTQFDKIMEGMTPERFAQIGVKPVLVNSNEMFYVTSSGQLLPFNPEGLQNAVNFEYRWLMTELSSTDLSDKNAVTDDLTA